MKKFIYTLLFNLLVFTSVYGQAGTISYHNTMTAGTSTSWTIDVKEVKAVRITYAIDVVLNSDNVTFFDINSSGTTNYPTSYPTGYCSGTYVTATKTGKAKITLYCNTTGMKNIEIQYCADNSIITSNDLNVGGNATISGNTILNGTIRGNQSAGALQVLTDYGYVTIGPLSGTLWAHIYTNMPQFIFNKPIHAMTGEFSAYNTTNMSLETNGTTRMTILQSNGNVGIGTTSPKFRLHIQGANANSDMMTLGSTTTGNFALTSADGLAYGLFAGVSSTGRAWLQAGRYDSSTAYDLTLQASGGNVGIGTTTPGSKLEVKGGNILVNGGDAVYTSTDTNGNFHHLIGSYQGWNQKAIYIAGYNSANLPSVATQYVAFGGGGYEKMWIDLTSGKVSIGTIIPDLTPGVLLTVNGSIHTKEVIVDLNAPLADYVFDTNYKLMPLNQVEQFVKTNNHLPEVPSAADVSKKGLNMGDMQNKLLQKVEELTLYMIDQQKTINQQSAEIEELEKKLK